MEVEHKIYKHVKDVKDADAVAKAVIDKSGTMVDYPFKFPQLKPYEIRARILTTGLCHTDVHISKSQWYDAVYPIVPGHEVISVITEIGSGVKDFKVGERVGFGPGRAFCGKCKNCQRGDDNLCQADLSPETRLLYDPYFGGYATHIQATEQACFHIPESLPTDRTPPLLCAGMTMFAPLVRWGSKDCKVGIVGIGGLGHLGVKYASKLGYHVTAFTSKPKEKEEEIKKMGAEAVLSSVDLAGLEAHKYQFDLLLNTFYTRDSKILNGFLGLLRSGGTYVQIALPDVHDPVPQININEICLRQLNLAGSIISNAKEMYAMLKFSAEHNILPDCEIFDWEDFPTAYKKCATGTAKYRCVVNCEKHAAKLGLK